MNHVPRATDPRFRAPTLLQLALALVLLAGLTACGGGLLGGGDTGPYDRPDETAITGEVERVEEYANEIDVWTADRQIVTIRYESDTPVYYRGQRGQATQLERGDVIRANVERTPSGAWLAERIEVVEARQERAEGDDPYGGDDPYYGPGDDRSVQGEVLEVDLDRRRMEIGTDRGRRVLTFGRGTPVYFRGQEYEVRNLEPGDVIRTEVDTSREPWRILDFVTVVQSRQERAGEDPYEDDYPYDEPYERPEEDWADAERFSGTVQEVDQRRGEFVLDTERYGLKTVVMPYNASRQDRTDFERLQRGRFVRIEGERLGGDRIELLRFGWADRR